MTIIMNTQKFRFVLGTLILLLSSGVVCAQGNYSYYLQYAKKHLDNGDCIRAKINYDMYVEMTDRTDREIERRIYECSSGRIRPEGEKLFGEELERVNDEIISKVKDFQRYVNNLAGNSFSHAQKEERYQMALDLFMGRGEPYDIIVPSMDGDDIQHHNAVQMCVIASKNSQKRLHYPMKQYLRNLIRNSENPNYVYKKIVIESSDVIKIDNYRKIGNGKYMALAHYVQKYSAYSSREMNRATYMDYTRKTIAVYIEAIETDQLDGSVETSIIVRLGDVDCEGPAW